MRSYRILYDFKGIVEIPATFVQKQHLPVKFIHYNIHLPPEMSGLPDMTDPDQQSLVLDVWLAAGLLELVELSDPLPERESWQVSNCTDTMWLVIRCAPSLECPWNQQLSFRGWKIDCFCDSSFNSCEFGACRNAFAVPEAFRTQHEFWSTPHLRRLRISDAAKKLSDKEREPQHVGWDSSVIENCPCRQMWTPSFLAACL